MRKHSLKLALLAVVTVMVSAPWATSQEDARVPAYNPQAPGKADKLPPLLGKEDLWGGNAEYPFQTHAYELAARIPALLHQQPCYCYCDRGMGHNSLHSCFEGAHGAQCSTCLKELYYTYSMNKQGKSARDIRAGIINGDWKTIDLEKSATIE